MSLIIAEAELEGHGRLRARTLVGHMYTNAKRKPVVESKHTSEM